MKKKDEIVLAPEQEVSIDDFYEDKGVTAIKELVGLILNLGFLNIGMHIIKTILVRGGVMKEKK